MNLSLENKNIVITGGTKGIGLSLAHGFLEEKANVFIISRTKDEATETFLNDRFPGKSFFYQCDVSDEESLVEICQKILQVTAGKIDTTIANVGSGRSVPDPVSDKESWNKVWDTNFNSALNTARVFHPSLSANKGSLLFISSIAGTEFIGAPTDYSTAKSALLAFSKSLSHRLAPAVRVNVIAPGNIFTEEGTWGNKMRENPGKVKEMLETKVPLQRFGKPEEVTDLALFLSSARASFITGGCFVIDGGQTIQF